MRTGRPGHDDFELQPCGHRFHAACVRRWFKRTRSTCPMCRADCSADAEVLLDGDEDWVPNMNMNDLVGKRCEWLRVGGRVRRGRLAAR
jgi:hypothetical protein